MPQPISLAALRTAAKKYVRYGRVSVQQTVLFDIIRAVEAARLVADGSCVDANGDWPEMGMLREALKPFGE